MKNRKIALGKKLRPPLEYLIWFFFIVVLAACSQPGNNTPPDAAQPELSVAEPFVLGEDGTYTATVSEDRVTIQGTQNGGIERLRFKLNETVWLDATLSSDDYSFEVAGLNDGTNTVTMRLDGKDGSVVVVVIVIIVDTGDGGTGEVNPDPNPRDMVALTDNNMLVFFNSATPQDTDTLNVTGVEGTLLGIDFRPANGELYALSSSNKLYTVDIGSGAATETSTLSSDFTGRARSGVDFNPVADRLRITGSNGQNFRVNVDTGEVIEDGTLAYVAGDTNESIRPSITASAYTNNVAGTTTTILYDIDATLNALALQNPPNDGGLQTLGTLGVDFEAVGGFDIFTNDLGINTAYALTGSSLYTLDLATGSATLRGTVSGGSFQGLAVIPDAMTPPAPQDPNPKDMIGLTDNNTLLFFNSGTPSTNTSLAVTNLEGNLLGIDFRPADGYLYGLSDANKLYTIDTTTGYATEKSLLWEEFEAGALSGVDFNPVADRLRLTGTNGQNFRVNVDTGEVILDGDLAFVDGDANDGQYPSITASGYTNSSAGATATMLYNIDAGLDILVLQDPPNDGGLKTVGNLGIDFAEVGGFDIFTDAQNVNTAYALTSGQIYGIDLTTGAATSFGTVSGAMFRGLAIVPQ
jgi:trimeric autotransporter adhesin